MIIMSPTVADCIDSAAEKIALAYQIERWLYVFDGLIRYFIFWTSFMAEEECLGKWFEYVCKQITMLFLSVYISILFS